MEKTEKILKITLKTLPFSLINQLLLLLFLILKVTLKRIKLATSIPSSLLLKNGQKVYILLQEEILSTKTYTNSLTKLSVFLERRLIFLKSYIYTCADQLISSLIRLKIRFRRLYQTTLIYFQIRLLVNLKYLILQPLINSITSIILQQINETFVQQTTTFKI